MKSTFAGLWMAGMMVIGFPFILLGFICGAISLCFGMGMAGWLNFLEAMVSWWRK